MFLKVLLEYLQIHINQSFDFMFQKKRKEKYKEEHNKWNMNLQSSLQVSSKGFLTYKSNALKLLLLTL